MIKYYELKIDLKKIIKVPQTKEVKGLNLNSFNISKEEYYLDSSQNHLKFIDFIPTTEIFEIWKSSIPTDIIYFLNNYSNYLISNKLKNIFENFSEGELQFFQTSIYHKDIEYKDYWYMHPTFQSIELIDFEKSRIELFKTPWDKESVLFEGIKNYNEFVIENKKLTDKFLQNLKITNLVLKETKKEILIINGIIKSIPFGFFVSEKIKNIIETEKCTGLIFFEMNEKGQYN